MIKKEKMSNLKSAWKYKIELKDIFDEKFLNEKDIALQPISFILEKENNLINNTLKHKKNMSANNNIIVKNKKDEEKEKKSQKSKKPDLPPKKKSLKKYEIYSSNIVIVQSITDGGSQDSSVDQIGKEVEKLKKFIKRSMTKYSKKNTSKSKGLKHIKSTKY